ncbi:hypothetical protein RB597_001614 [Gaeumannomyces tritici]
MYANVWQNYNDLDTAGNRWPVVVGGGGGGDLGTYPSGGATSNVLYVWLRFGRSLDFVAPDVYLNDYEASCARRDEYGVRRIWAAYGSHGCMGTAPFGCDTLGPGDENPFTRHYELLESVALLVLEAQRSPGPSVGFFFDELPPADADGHQPPGSSRPMVKHWGGYEVTIERCFVFGRPGDGTGMVVHRGGGRFLLIGYGFQVRARATSARATFTGILRFEEKRAVSDGDGGVRLETLRTLNGDKTRSVVFAVMLGPDPDYGGFPSCVTVPAKTMIAELSFYHMDYHLEEEQSLVTLQGAAVLALMKGSRNTKALNTALDNFLTAQDVFTPTPTTHFPPLTMQLLNTILALAAAAAPAAAYIDGLTSAPATASAGQTITATLHSSIYIQNFDDYGVVWGLAPASINQGNCGTCVGRRIGYTNVFGPQAGVTVPPNGDFDVSVTIPEGTQAGQYALVAGASYLVGASGVTGFHLYNKTITIA